MLPVIVYFLLATVSMMFCVIFLPITMHWASQGFYFEGAQWMFYAVSLAFAALAVLFFLLIIRRFKTKQVCFHKWDGCICVRCGRKRDKEHDWDGCVCTRCGKKRNEEHDWDGCVCTRCGRERDELHEWHGCICIKCGKERDELHHWDGCVCRICGKTRHDLDERCVCRMCGGAFHDETMERCRAGNDRRVEVSKCARCGQYL